VVADEDVALKALAVVEKELTDLNVYNK